VNIINGLLAILCGVVMFVCIAVSYRWLLGYESVALTLLLNFFFITIFSQLNGVLSTKILMLITGNILGVALNLLFYAFADNIHMVTGLQTSAVLTVIFPILNLIWIIPFWSLSLSLLSNRTLTEKVQEWS
jgi:hypothetical protein